MDNRQDLDNAWRETLKDKSRFSLEWYRDHIITKELLGSGVLSGKVIDLGCGIGARAYIAAEMPAVDYIIGVDASAFAISYAIEHYGSHKNTFHICDVTELGWIWTETLDNAYCLAVIEHVQDTHKLLSEAWRVLKPCGRLFISVTENDYHSDPSHVYVFDMESLRDTLSKYFYGEIENVYVKEHIVFAICKKLDGKVVTSSSNKVTENKLHNAYAYQAIL